MLSTFCRLWGLFCLLASVKMKAKDIYTTKCLFQSDTLTVVDVTHVTFLGILVRHNDGLYQTNLLCCLLGMGGKLASTRGASARLPQILAPEFEISCFPMCLFCSICRKLRFACNASVSFREKNLFRKPSASFHGLNPGQNFKNIQEYFTNLELNSNVSSEVINAANFCELNLG